MGSPIAGCILLASNFGAFGQRHASRQALLLGVASMVVVFALAFALPENVPNAVLPIAYTAAIHTVAKRMQGAQFEAYLSQGGLKHSHWRVVALGVGCLIAVAVLLVALVMLLPPELFGEDAA